MMRQAPKDAAREAHRKNPTWARRAAGSLLVIGMACAVLAQKPPAGGSASQEPGRPQHINAQAQALLDKTLNALGGQAFLDFTTLSTRGRIFSVSEGETAGTAPFQSQMLYPDKRRFSYGKDKPVIVINNGEQGWEKDRYGEIDLDSQRTHNWAIANRYSMVNLLRVVARAKGTLVLTAGTDFVDLQPVRVLEIVDSHGVDVKLYVQSSSYLPVRIAYRTRQRQDQDWTDVAEVYSDYQTFQGIQTPMHVTRYEDGSRTLELFRTRATYNEQYPPDTFQP
jgi:hypothetical protein